jgi:hypothetical protein
MAMMPRATLSPAGKCLFKMESLLRFAVASLQEGISRIF